jgi:hypothetical protein
VLSANYNLPGAAYQWYLNGNIINGATDSTYTFTQNGIYSVEVINATGCDYTYTYTVTNTGMDEQTLSEISASPNPFNDVITISNSLNKDLNIKLTDITGSTKTLYQSASSKFTLPLNELASGIYFLTLQANNGLKTIKLVKR